MNVNYFLHLLIVMVLSTPVAQAQVDAEKLIWEQESRYIQAYRNADHDLIINLWHKNFLGWPSMERKPIKKQAGLHFLKQRYRQPQLWDFTIEPQSIQVTGDIAITQYLLKTWPANKTKNRRVKISRIVHTWLNEDGHWKVLGGMSAPWTLGNQQ